MTSSVLNQLIMSVNPYKRLQRSVRRQLWFTHVFLAVLLAYAVFYIVSRQWWWSAYFLVLAALQVFMEFHLHRQRKKFAEDYNNYERLRQIAKDKRDAGFEIYGISWD